MSRSKTFDKIFSAAMFFDRTGKHKQVTFRYNPESRTEFDFGSWKHDRDSDSMRSILVEDIRISTDGNCYVVGYDNRYNLKQFSAQYPQHYRAYRMDRMVTD